MSKLNRFPSLPSTPLFIGFAGRIGVGKTSAAEYLANEYGFANIRYSQVLQDWRLSTAATKTELQAVGWEVMDGGGQLELNKHLIARLNRGKSTVVDGLRHPTDFDCLLSNLGPAFQLVFIRAPQSTRFERICSRFASFSEFEAADRQPVESHIDELLASARFVISNDGPIEYLYKQLDNLLAEVFAGGCT